MMLHEGYCCSLFARCVYVICQFYVNVSTTFKFHCQKSIVAGLKMLNLTSSRPSGNKKIKHSLAGAVMLKNTVDITVHVLNTRLFSTCTTRFLQD